MADDRLLHRTTRLAVICALATAGTLGAFSLAGCNNAGAPSGAASSEKGAATQTSASSQAEASKGESGLAKTEGSVDNTALVDSLQPADVKVATEEKRDAGQTSEVKSGTLPVPPAMDYPHMFSFEAPLWLSEGTPQGPVALSSKEGPYGYLGQDFSWAIKPQFQSAENFKYGYALVGKDRFGEPATFVIDTKGNDVLGEPLPFELVNAPNLLTLQKDDPKTQLAKFKKFKADYPQVEQVTYAGENLFVASASEEWTRQHFTLPQNEDSYLYAASALIDADFNIVRDFDPYAGDLVFTEGLAPYNRFSLDGASCGYLDTKGTKVFEGDFLFPGDFYDGVAVACLPSKDEEGTTVSGLIDKNGNWVVKPTFAMIDQFRLGVANATVKEGDTWKNGLIDTKGNWVIKPTAETHFWLKLTDDRYLGFGEDLSIMDGAGKTLAKAPYGYVTILETPKGTRLIVNSMEENAGGTLYDQDGNKLIDGYHSIDAFGENTYVCYERRWEEGETDAYVILDEEKRILHREAAGPNDAKG